MKYWAGIGSRSTPPDIMELMKEIASILEKQGWTLRSGGAQGADSAFASGVEKNAEIWIPWESFAAPRNPNHTYKVIDKNDKEAFDSVNQFHPNGLALRDSVRALQARNFRQLIGLNSKNSSFVLCWTPKGEVVGGTGQALRVAAYFSIPIFNLGKEEDCDRISTWLKLQQRREPKEQAQWEYLEEDPMNEQFYGQG